MSILLRKIIFIAVLALGALYISLPPVYVPKVKIGKFEFQKTFDLKLGLDLAGGSHLVFDADMSKIPGEKKNTALEGVRDVIEKRVNLFGVSEPTVQTSNFEGKDRIIVELPGIKDTKEAISLIGKTAQLLFAEVEEIPGKVDASPSATLKPTDLTGADLQNAKVDFDSNTGKPGISLTFTKEGGDKFAKITERNIGKQVYILLDGSV